MRTPSYVIVEIAHVEVVSFYKIPFPFITPTPHVARTSAPHLFLFVPRVLTITLTTFPRAWASRKRFRIHFLTFTTLDFL